MMKQQYLDQIETVNRKGKYQASWESLSQYSVPEWYKNAKFGIFIHWGLYSVPAYGNEWYSKNMYDQSQPEFQHHLATYGPHKDFGYKDFIPLFTAEKFEPLEWLKLFKKSGVKYVVPVAEHHDGFQMYKSDVSKWNAFEMGPKRNILADLSAATEKEGLVFGVSSHRVEHWFFMGHGKNFDSDVKEPMVEGDFYWPAMPEPNHQDKFSQPEPTKAFLEDWLVRTCEIVDLYQPKVIYFDWWIQHQSVKPYLKKFAAYYYNRAEEWQEGVVINYKHDALMFGTGVVDIERGGFTDIKPYVWQSDTSLAKNSWCYTENNEFKTAQTILTDLVDIVSKNGCMLLNVGPKADGTITSEEREILEAIGSWLEKNGEAIYATETWRIAGEGPTEISEGYFSDNEERNYTSEDFRFTVKGAALYATCLNPSESELLIKSLAADQPLQGRVFNGIIQNVSILGEPSPCVWEQTVQGLRVVIGDRLTNLPLVVKIVLE